MTCQRFDSCGSSAIANVYTIDHRSQQSAGSMETVGGVSAHSSSADNNTTATTESHNSSQTPSCRALAGSLASFDTSSIVNTEGL